MTPLSAEVVAQWPENDVSPLVGSLLKKSRRLRRRFLRGRGYGDVPPVHLSGQAASNLIREKLLAPEPFMLGRLGRCEIRGMLQYVDIVSPGNPLRKSWDYVTGKIGPFWWDKHIRHRLNNNAGFFPPTHDMIRRYSLRMLEDIREIDVLGSIHPEETRVLECFPDAIRIPILDAEPYLHAHPWSEILEGKTVLVVYPFSESIRHQFARRKKLFADPRVLPDFELRTLKAVQSVAGTPVDFPDWFAALDSMCEQINQVSFDIAIIGAGAYGLPLAAHVKRQGKKAIHLGGATQILFGVLGKRWEGHPDWKHLFNDFWVHPGGGEVIDNAKAVEGACYW